MTREIQLGGKKAGGRVALVDDEDFELVSQYHWFVQERPARPGHGATGPYAITNFRYAGRRTAVAMHQMISGYPRTDHVNHDGLDNRRSNLRPYHEAWQNNANQRKIRGILRYKGIAPQHWKPGSWLAQIQRAGKQIYLGTFATQEEAALAYDHAAVQYFSEFACTNQDLGLVSHDVCGSCICIAQEEVA